MIARTTFMSIAITAVFFIPTFIPNIRNDYLLYTRFIAHIAYLIFSRNFFVLFKCLNLLKKKSKTIALVYWLYMFIKVCVND